jgi:hypothetical protein
MSDHHGNEVGEPDYDAVAAYLTNPDTELQAPRAVYAGESASACGREFAARE